MNIDWWCLKVDESFSHPFFSWSTNNSSKKIGGINACTILIFFLHCLLIYMFIDLTIFRSSFYYWYARSTMEIKSIATIEWCNNRMGISTFYWVGMQLTKQEILETYMQYDEYTHKIYDCIIQNIVSCVHAMVGGDVS